MWKKRKKDSKKKVRRREVKKIRQVKTEQKEVDNELHLR